MVVMSKPAAQKMSQALKRTLRYCCSCCCAAAAPFAAASPSPCHPP
jgi:hypothetical protein